MSATTSGMKSRSVNMEFLRKTAGYFTGAARSYISDAMPSSTSIVSEAKNTMSEINSAFSSASQAIFPTINKMKKQKGFRGIFDWFMEKESEFDSISDSEFTNWDGDIDEADIAETQITEMENSSNKISRSVIESSHQLAEAQIASTGSIINKLNEQSAIISSGFERTNKNLEKILEVVTKNTATLIETTVAASAINTNNGNGSSMLNSKFNLSDYKNLVKKQLGDSELGVLGSMLPMVFNKDLMTAGNVTSMLIQAGINKAAPNLKNNMKALDDAVSDTIMSSLIRIGERSNEYGNFGLLGRVFGIKSDRNKTDTSRSTLQIKSVPYDTMSKEALTGAIPGYLERILVAVGGDDLVYDYRSRTFKTKKKLKKEFRDVSASRNNIYNASRNVRNTLGTDRFTSMTYDLMMNDLGSKAGNGSQARDIVKSFSDVNAAQEYIINTLYGGKLNGKDLENAKKMAARLSRLPHGFGEQDIMMQVAKNNVNRNSRMEKYVNNADMYGVDLSFIEDSPKADRNALLKLYGRRDLVGDDSIKVKGNTASKNLSGLNYTNMALYEIFRRLDTGINVFQVGSKKTRKNQYKKLGDEVLAKPLSHKPKNISNTSSDESTQTISGGSHYGDDYENPLLNNTDEDGMEENLSRSERLKRWGKKRGGNLAHAVFSGSPEEVRAAFGDIIRDAAGVAGHQIKSGANKLSDNYGNVKGYLRHKLTGKGYSYNNGTDEMTVSDNEKGGLLGFARDELKGLFGSSKESVKKWTNDVMKYFDYGDGDKDEKGIASKRKRLIGMSIGAFAGAGILGGPIGLLAGSLAGSALSSGNIGQKIKDKLLGRDDETGKASGLLTKGFDKITRPLQYQFAKSANFLGGVMKKNVLGPISDLGLAIKDRAMTHVDNAFNKWILDPAKKIGSGILKGAGWLGDKAYNGLIGAFGTYQRGKIEAGTSLFGGMTGLLASGIAGSKSGHYETDPVTGEKIWISTKDSLKERRAARKRDVDLERDRYKFGSYKDWNTDQDLRAADRRRRLKDYTSESEKRTEQNTSEVAENTAEISETLKATQADQSKTNEIERKSHEMMQHPGSIYTHDIHLEKQLDQMLVLLGGRPVNSESVRGMKKVDIDDGSNDFANSAIGAAASIAMSGDDITNDESKAASDIIDEATKGNSNKSRISQRLKDLMGIQKKKSDNAENKEDSFISKLLGGVGSVLLKSWPFILGGITLLSDKFREAIGGIAGNIGSMLKDVLPDILKGAFNIAEDINQGFENSATGATTVVDEVTGEKKSVISAEQHASHIENGIFKSAKDITMNPFRLAKDVGVMSLERSAIRLGAGTIKAGAGALGVGSSLINGTVKLAQGGSAFIQGVRSAGGLSRAGLTKGAEFFTRTMALGGSRTAQGVASGSAKVAAGAGGIKNMMGKLTNLRSYLNVTTAANIVGSVASDVSAGIGWEAAEISKNANIVGDYGMGKLAAGFVGTSTTAKTITTTAIGTGGGIAIAAAVGTAKTALAATIAGAAAGVGGAGAANGWNPIGWCMLVIAAVLAISAALAALVNLLVGVFTDNADKDYAIRSNSAKLHKLINSTIQYENGKENPIYVYCGRESDRVLGITKGMNIKDPELMFGKFLKEIADGLTTAPGVEVLLYDLLNNMAVQGVPFACLVAGDSDECTVKGKHANKNTCGDAETTDTSGIFGGTAQTQVLKSTVRRNKDIVLADIVANISRQDSSAVWNEEDLKTVYDAGKKVVNKLTDNGILKKDGSVDTKKFKGTPGGSKNTEGWEALDKICRKEGSYFLTQCLIYINSKIEVNKSGQQWLESRQNDIVKLMDGLKDYFVKESKDLVNSMKSQGMSDDEIADTLANKMADPKGTKAQEASSITEAESSISAIGSSGIKSSDKADVDKELRYLTASYAYSHPDLLHKWVSKHLAESGFSIDDVDMIPKWKGAFGDKRREKILRNDMATAALNFAKSQGDIFNLIPKFDWSEDGSIYGGKNNPGDKYGSGFVLRGGKKKPGKGDLAKLWDSGKVGQDKTPEDIHKSLFGSGDHNKGSEDGEITGFEGGGVIEDIAKMIADYGSSEGTSMGANGDYFDPWKNILKNLQVGNPPNLAIGGPVSILDTDPDSDPNKPVADISSSAISNGGNPLSKPFKITSGFGFRSYPDEGMHEGIDMAPADGTSTADVTSRYSGTVIDVKKDVPNSDHAVTGPNGDFEYYGNNETGNMVTIEGPGGKIIKNMHLKAGSIPGSIRVGSKISAGTKIGEMGSTGRSLGSHLHYQIEDKEGNPIDPTASLYDNQSVSSIAGTSGYDSYISSGYSSGYSSVTSSSGPLAQLLEVLKQAGSTFLNKISGGLFGTDYSSSVDTDGYVSQESTFGTSYSSGGVFLTNDPNTEWVSIVRDVKKLVADQMIQNNLEYNQSGYITINYQGNNLKVRTDCTGIIAAMLKIYGVLPMNGNVNSTSLLNKGTIPSGFTQAPWPGWDKLVEGDIVVKSGHAEIFASNDGGKHYVYNGGSTKSLKSAGATGSSYAAYSVIWRCNEAGSAISGTNKSSAKNIADAAMPTKASSEQDVWNYLKKLGYTDEAAAGIMGVWANETGNRSDRLEGDYIFKDAFNTALKSNEALDDYTLNRLFPAYKKVNIRKSAYIGEDGHYYPGVGIAQWTGPRGRKLFEYASSKGMDWKNLDGQMEFFQKEMVEGTRGIRPDDVNSKNSPTEVADIFAKKYEGTSNNDWINKRKASAKAIYGIYARGNNETAIGGPSSSIGKVKYKRGSISSSNINITNGNNNSGSTFSLPGSRRPVGIPDATNVNNPQNIAEVVSMLSQVIRHLEVISSNTGESNDLLDSLNQKSQGSSTKIPKSSNKKSGVVLGSSNATNSRLISGMARP